MTQVAEVVVVAWYEEVVPQWSRARYQRRELLREQLVDHLRIAGIAHRVVLSKRVGHDRRAATAVVDALAAAPRPLVVVCCAWDLDTQDAARLAALHRAGTLRVLVVSTAEPDPLLPTVGCLQSTAGIEAARHCIARSWRRLLFIAPYDAPWVQARAAGVGAAASEAGIAVRCELARGLALADHLAAAPAAQDADLLARLLGGLAALDAGDHEAETAIIACNDRTALAVRRVLGDFAGGLMGFDDDDGAAAADLTSLRLPIDHLARRGAELAVELAGGGRAPLRTMLPWELVLRGSTRRQRPTTARGTGRRATGGDSATDHSRIGLPVAGPGAASAVPPVLMLHLDAIPGGSANQMAHSARLARVRDSFLATMARSAVPAGLQVCAPDDDALAAAVEQALAAGTRSLVLQEFRGGPRSLALLDAAQAAGRLQVVHSDTAVNPTEHIAVMLDQGAAGTMAVTHCLRQGYRRLLFLGPFSEPWCRDRAQSARRALLLSNWGSAVLMLAPELPRLDAVTYSRMPAGERQALIAQLLDEGLARLPGAMVGSNPTAVITANDLVSLDLLAVLPERELLPGSGLGIIGFDNLAESEAHDLSTLDPPLTALGHETARTIIRLLRGDQVSRRTCLPWGLIARGSTKLA